MSVDSALNTQSRIPLFDQLLETIQRFTLALKPIDLCNYLFDALQYAIPSLDSVIVVNIERSPFRLLAFADNLASLRLSSGMVCPWLDSQTLIRIAEQGVLHIKESDHPILRYFQLHSAVLGGMVSAEQSLTFVLMGRRTPEPFTEEEIKCFQLYIGQAALVMARFVEIERFAHHNDLLQSECDLLEAILETTNDGILMIDTEREIVAINLTFETLFNLPRYLYLHRPIDVLIQGMRDRQDIPRALGSLLMQLVNAQYETSAGDFSMLSPDKRVVVWYSAPVYTGDSLAGRLVVFRDATYERELDRMKTEFLSLVSHELRTPLTSVKGFTEMVLEGDAGEISQNVREFLDIVRLNTDHLVNLINDIIDITRIEARRIELRQAMHALSHMIDAAVINTKGLLAKRHQHVTVHVEPQLPTLWTDSDRIRQVISNLLSNASKYSDPETEIVIEAFQIHEADQIVAPMPTSLRLPSIVVAVHDRGIGISEADQENLFKRFYRAEQVIMEQIGGTGLGLAIAKAFIELHHGQIWFKSELGVGSSFYFSLPIVDMV